MPFQPITPDSRGIWGSLLPPSLMLHLPCFFLLPSSILLFPSSAPPPSPHTPPDSGCQAGIAIYSDRRAKKSKFSFSVPEIYAGSGAGSRSWMGKADGECSACRLQPRRKAQEQMGFSLSCQSIVYCQVAVFACVNLGRDSVSGFY